jgi:hypothetical protein
VPTVNSVSEAELWKKPVLTGSQLEVSVTGINSNIHKYVSGGSIKGNIEPLSANPVTNSNLTLFKSRVFMTFSVVFWTEALPDEVLLTTSQTKTVKWLQLITTTESNTMINYHTYPFFATYNTYSPPQLKAEATGFRGLVNITPSLNSLTPFTMTFGNEEITIKSREFYAVPKELLVIDSNAVRIGNYTTKVDKIGETHLAVMDIGGSTIENVKGYGKDAETALLNAIGGLGVFRQPQNKPTFQQGVYSLPSTGANLLTNLLDLTMKPNIRLINEPLLVKRRDPLVVDIQTNTYGFPPLGWTAYADVVFVSSSGILEYTIPDRPIGWEVENYAVKIDLQCEFELFSLAEITQKADPTKPGLKYPILQLADYFWQSLIGGDTGATIVFDSTSWLSDFLNQLWQQYWWVFIIIGVVALGGGFLYFRFGTPIGKALGSPRIMGKNAGKEQLPSKNAKNNEIIKRFWEKLSQ